MLKKKLCDNRGNALVAAILICLVLSIILGGLATSTIINTNVTLQTTETEKAYLAARSGIEMMKNIGLNEDQADMVREARVEDSYTGTDKDVHIDLGDMGEATIKVVELKLRKQKRDAAGVPQYLANGKPDYEEVIDDTKVKLVARGECNGNSYVITRRIDLAPSDRPLDDDGEFFFQSKAYTKVGDAGTASSPSKISGGIEGDVIIVGDGYLTFTAAQKDHPLHNLIVKDNLDLLGGQDTDIDLMATGGHLSITDSRGTRIHGDVIVGLKENLGTANDPWFEVPPSNNSGTTIEGKLLVEGAIKNLTNTKIGTDPGNKNQYVPTPVVYAGGDVNFTQNGWWNNIYGTVIVGGDLKINNSTNIYGDVICYGNVTGTGGQINGSIYAAGNVTYTGTLKGDVYAGGACSISGAKTNLITGSSTDTSYFKNKKYTYSSEVSKSSDVAILKNQLETTFNMSIDWVGADEYITKELASSPVPRINIPPELYSAPVVSIGSSRNSAPVEITQNCILEGDGTTFGLGDGERHRFLYLNAASNDIDILFRGTLNLQGFASIMVNDGGGAHKVRLFMEDGSSINVLTNYQTTWFVPVSDRSPGISAEELVNLKAVPNCGWSDNTYVDLAKVPRFYIFTEKNGSSISKASLGLSNSGYVPGYVIAPGLKIKIDTGRIYIENKNGDPTKWSFNGNKLPMVYGLLMCDDMDFGDYQGTSLKYDTRLQDKTTERYAEFSRDIADVVTYDE